MRHYCITWSNNVWTQILCRFKPCLWRVRICNDENLWGRLQLEIRRKCFSLVKHSAKTSHYHHISTCSKPMGTKLGKVVSYCRMLPPFKSHDPWITWLATCHLTNWKKIISTCTRLVTTKLGSVMNSWRKFTEPKRLSRHQLLVYNLISF